MYQRGTFVADIWKYDPKEVDPVKQQQDGTKQLLATRDSIMGCKAKTELCPGNISRRIMKSRSVQKNRRWWCQRLFTRFKFPLANAELKEISESILAPTQSN